MHHHEVYITMLKTPNGYLTRTGFTNDINDKDIILIPSNTYGIWSTITSRIKYFLKEYCGSNRVEMSDTLLQFGDDIETVIYKCIYSNRTYCCYGHECECKANCQFWKDRADVKLNRIY